ncbi:hypothetical protein AAFF_G00280670, partial [Aldrovandia affinis]
SLSNQQSATTADLLKLLTSTDLLKLLSFKLLNRRDRFREIIMKCRIAAAVCLLFLAALSAEGMSVSGIGVDLRCRCIETESRRMMKLIQSMEMFPPSAHCKDTEIIATLRTGQQICLNPTAPWVNKVIQRILENKTL